MNAIFFKECLTEDQEAQLLMKMANLIPVARDYLFCIENGGYRNIREASKLKRKGVRAGVSDYFLPYPAHGMSGLWIELKRKNKVISGPTDAQLEWLEKMRNLGYATEIAYGADEAISIIKNYLNKENDLCGKNIVRLKNSW